MKYNYKKVIWLAFHDIQKGIPVSFYIKKANCVDVSNFVKYHKSSCVYTKYAGNKYRLIFRNKEVENLFFLLFNERMYKSALYLNKEFFYFKR